VDTTIAQIANGATIVVGDGAVGNSGANGASVYVDAEDTAYMITVAGSIATSNQNAIGISAAGNFIDRDTEAVIGDLAGDTTSGSGSLASIGDVRVDAADSGFIGSFAVAGSVASSSPESKQPAGGGSSNPGTGGTQGSNGSAQMNSDQQDWQSKIGACLNQYVNEGKGTGNVASTASTEISKTSESKAALGISGSATANIIIDDARAYVYNMGTMTIGNGELLVDSSNNTIVTSLAGGAAYAGSSSKSSTGIAGAFGINVMTGTTDAFVAGLTSLSAKGLDIEAKRDGWLVSLAAGLSGATGKSGTAVAGSVGVDVTIYTTEAYLEDIGTVTITGPVTVNAEDDNYLIAVGGSGAFGGQTGVGVAIGFSYSGNTTLAEISDVTNLTHSGDLNVLATDNGLIVSVTGSAGISTGSGDKGYGGAGTVSVNILENSVEAEILNSITKTGSTGNITVQAKDDTSIYSFAGAFGAGKTVGLGAAIAVNVLGNTDVALVQGSTLHTTGTFTAKALENGTVVTLAAGGAGSQKLAIAGGVAINVLTNTIAAEVTEGSEIFTGGDIDLYSEDDEISVALGGGVAGSSGSGAVGAAIGVNLVFNTDTAEVDDSTLSSSSTSTSASSPAVDIGAESEDVVVSVTLGGAGANNFALGGSVSANVVMSTIGAEVLGGSTVTAPGDIAIDATDSTTVVVVAGGFAGASGTAVGLAASSTYVQNDTEALIDASAVTSMAGSVSLAAGMQCPSVAANLSDIDLGISGISLPSISSSQVINLTVGGAGAGDNAGGAGISVNIIDNTIEAVISGDSSVTASGDVTLSAIDASVIDALAFGAAGAGDVAGGIGIAANVITNTISTSISGSTVESTGGKVSLDSESSPVIRALAIGVSGSGDVAVSVAALGNAVSDKVTATITDSTVKAYGDVLLSAEDVAPSLIPEWGLSSSDQNQLNNALSGSPISLTGNILAVMVSVAGSGDVAVGASLMGNVITNTVETEISGGSVKAGVNSSGTIINSLADIMLTTLSDDGIVAISVGVG